MTTEIRSSLSLLPEQEGTIKVVCEMLPLTGLVGVYLPEEPEERWEFHINIRCP